MTAASRWVAEGTDRDSAVVTTLGERTAVDWDRAYEAVMALAGVVFTLAGVAGAALLLGGVGGALLVLAVGLLIGGRAAQRAAQRRDLADARREFAARQERTAHGVADTLAPPLLP